MRLMIALCVVVVFSVAGAWGQDDLTEKERSKLESQKDAARADAAIAPPSTPEPAVPVVEATKPAPPITIVPTPAVPEPVPAVESISDKPVKPVPAVGEPSEPVPDANAKPVSAEAVAPPPPAGTAPQSAGDRAEPLPVAIVDTILTVCLPTLRGDQALVEGLPASVEEGSPDFDRFIARPQDGDYWTLPSLEGPMLVGNLHEREGACQVMGATPLGGIVMEKVTEALGNLESPFTVVDETGEDFGTPIHWRRFLSAESDYIDVLHYKGVPGGQASTIHVIVG